MNLTWSTLIDRARHTHVHDVLELWLCMGHLYEAAQETQPDRRVRGLLSAWADALCHRFTGAIEPGLWCDCLTVVRAAMVRSIRDAGDEAVEPLLIASLRPVPEEEAPDQAYVVRALWKHENVTACELLEWIAIDQSGTPRRAARAALSTLSVYAASDRVRETAASILERIGETALAKGVPETAVDRTRTANEPLVFHNLIDYPAIQPLARSAGSRANPQLGFALGRLEAVAVGVGPEGTLEHVLEVCCSASSESSPPWNGPLIGEAANTLYAACQVALASLGAAAIEPLLHSVAEPVFPAACSIGDQEAIVALQIDTLLSLYWRATASQKQQILDHLKSWQAGNSSSVRKTASQSAFRWITSRRGWRP